MLEEVFQNVKGAQPLVHCITNYVTVNDCANILLAAGSSPIMADDLREAAEITALCSSLCLNIGTLNERTVRSMLASGKEANRLGKPVVFDPVGAGASEFRTSTAFELLRQVRFTVIRGNSSEIKTIAKGSGTTKGVDADESDAVSAGNLDSMIAFAKDLSARTGAVIAITGAMDIVADSASAYVITNGHPMMAKITGTGCMLSALLAAFAAANPGHVLDAAAAAVCLMGLCGEIAYRKTAAQDGGTAAFRMHLIDAVSQMTADRLKGGARIEKR
jgi:hydroxyethylthiazole kinase